MKLEDLQPNAELQGVLPNRSVSVVNVQWFGSEALELTYKDSAGKVGNVLLYRHDEPRLELVEQGRPWSFDGDGETFRLVSEAHRIHLAHLFDPVLAVHTSLVDPLPHQITAVYQAMLPRQPPHGEGLGPSSGPGGQTSAGTGPDETTEPTTAGPALPRRFHGSVCLDATRVGRDASRIADEVISHLGGLLGARVQVTLEIEAHLPDGAPEHVVRTVTENSRTLKFTSHGFERE